MPGTIRYEIAPSGVATITLARPERRNALDAATFDDLAEIVEAAAADDSARCVLVRGEGPSFCSGIDVDTFAQLAGAGPEEFPRFIARAQRAFRTLPSMAKPTVAAVRGHALGAGFQLALACDLRLAAEDATFGMLEIRFGLLPDLGGHGRLVALAGPAVAKELLWTGRKIDAPEAERIGVVNRVVPTDVLEKEAAELAEALASAPPLPVRATKSIVDQAAGVPLGELMDREAQAQAANLASEDHREAVAAFFEKRTPRFRGN